LKIHVDEKTPVGRPVVENQTVGRQQSLQFAGTISSRNVNVLSSSVMIGYISHPFAVTGESWKYIFPPSETRVLVPLAKS
jgi:hypothetical protein